MTTEVKYEVTYTPSDITKVGQLMSRLDLDIVDIEMPVTYLYLWNTTTEVTPAYLTKMKRAIRKGLKELGVTKIHSIKNVT